MSTTNNETPRMIVRRRGIILRIVIIFLAALLIGLVADLYFGLLPKFLVFFAIFGALAAAVDVAVYVTEKANINGTIATILSCIILAVLVGNTDILNNLSRSIGTSGEANEIHAKYVYADTAVFGETDTKDLTVKGTLYATDPRFKQLYAEQLFADDFQSEHSELKDLSTDENGLKLNGDLTVKSLIVEEDETIKGNQIVEGSQDVNGNQKVGGNQTVEKDQTINGNSTVMKDLNVKGNANVDKNLNVHGDANIDGNAKVGGDLDVDGNVNVNGDINVNGNINTSTSQTAPPQTAPPETRAPQTYAPQTYAPQTQAPQTQAPQTQAPQTQAPQTQAPQTQAPQTQAPQTPPTSQQTSPSQTAPPQTQAPSTSPTSDDTTVPPVTAPSANVSFQSFDQNGTNYADMSVYIDNPTGDEVVTVTNGKVIKINDHLYRVEFDLDSVPDGVTGNGMISVSGGNIETPETYHFNLN